jgi:hypothetical protein
VSGLLFTFQPPRGEQQPPPLLEGGWRVRWINPTASMVCRVCELPQRGQFGFQPVSFFWIEAKASKRVLHFSQT